MMFRWLLALTVVFVSPSIASCASDKGLVTVHWQPFDPTGKAIACGSGDKVHVSFGIYDNHFACDVGGGGTDPKGNAFVGGISIDSVTVGGPYNLFLELIDGGTGYIRAQAVLPAVGDVQSSTPLDVGTVPLLEVAPSGPYAGLPSDSGAE